MPKPQKKVVGSDEGLGDSCPGEPAPPGSGARSDFPVALRSCEETRARRDVLRLRGDAEAAEALGATLEAQLAGRELPPPPYERAKR